MEKFDAKLIERCKADRMDIWAWLPDEMKQCIQAADMHQAVGTGGIWDECFGPGWYGGCVYRIHPDWQPPESEPEPEPPYTDYDVVESAVRTWLVNSWKLHDIQNRTGWLGTPWRRELPNGDCYEWWVAPGATTVTIHGDRDYAAGLAGLADLSTDEILNCPPKPVRVRMRKDQENES